MKVLLHSWLGSKQITGLGISGWFLMLAWHYHVVGSWFPSSLFNLEIRPLLELVSLGIISYGADTKVSAQTHWLCSDKIVKNTKLLIFPPTLKSIGITSLYLSLCQQKPKLQGDINKQRMSLSHQYLGQSITMKVSLQNGLIPQLPARQTVNP